MVSTQSAIDTIPVPVANGGTGAATLTGAVVGNGTSAMTAGTLTVANGGTGVATLTGIPYASGTSNFAALTIGNGLNQTSGTLNVVGGGMNPNATSGTSATGATQNSYVCSNSAQTSISLPATSAVGDFLLVVGTSANTGGIKITQATGQEIFQTTNHSTSGATGNVATGAANTSMLLVCTAANTTWMILSNQGTVTFT
jgi:hypothetical protein